MFLTLLFIFSHLDEFHVIVMKKFKFDLAKAKLKRQIWLAFINSGRFLTTLIIIARNKKEISEISCKTFIFVLQFAGLPQEKISMNLPIQFWPLIL